MGADKSAYNITNTPKIYPLKLSAKYQKFGIFVKKGFIAMVVRIPRERIICKVENALGLEFHHPSILRNTTPGQLNYCVQRTSQKIARLGSKDHIKSKIIYLSKIKHVKANQSLIP
jgi:hypothetical protein